MDFFKKIKDYLEKIRKLPERSRKVILWVTLFFSTLVVGIIYAKVIQSNFKKIKEADFKKEFKIDKLEEDLKNLPKIEIPEIKMPETTSSDSEREFTEEELKEMEEEFKKMEEEFKKLNE